MKSAIEQKQQQDKRLKENLSNIKYKLLVISGKGGVGKTTVSVNLAYGLAMKGYNVGILDVDIHGPNVAKMLGIEDEKLTVSKQGIEPIKALSNLEAVSLALTGLRKDQPVIWRGPLKMIAIKQLLSDVNWGKLDYLIIDSPPGTGDEPLSIAQLIKDLTGAIVVTTPQDVAILDSRKAVLFAKELKIPITGIIENMSGLLCPHCKNNIDLFGKEGGKKAAGELGIPFLGSIPLEPEVVHLSDSGKPPVGFRKDTQIAKTIDEILTKIIGNLKKGTICKWFSSCPLKEFYEQGKLDKKWIEDYCNSNNPDCVRKKMEEKSQYHPDNMMPDGTIDKRLV